MSGIFSQHEERDRLVALERGSDHSADGWSLVRVALERGIERAASGKDETTGNGIDSTLTYKSRTPIGLGRRVEVPLGRGNTCVGGIVVAAGGPELADGFPLGKIKAVLRDTGTGLPPELVSLALWMSEYYVCPMGMVLAAMLPSAVKLRTGLRSVTMLQRSEVQLDSQIKLTPRVRSAGQALADLPAALFPIAPHALQDQLGTRTLAEINAMVKAGMLVEVRQEHIRQSGAGVGGAGQSNQMGIEQALGVRGDESPARVLPTLTPAQTHVIDGIGQRLRGFAVHLLRGVTGSGKTEIYLRVLDRVLQTGRTGLVLVPEISLTPQTAGRFVERFGGVGVAVMHSGLSASQRHAEWARALSGSARVVVGARSAIFAPLEKLGLIVVDEEHASDYKQDQLPRYHGRDVAIKRAQLLNIPVMLGSATPALESWVNAIGESPKYALWELTERVGGGVLPPVEIVDLKNERKLQTQFSKAARDGKHPNAGLALASRDQLIGPTLGAAMAETFDSGGQVLLLLNRRGYACYIACASSQCGFVLGCEHCDARMVQHRVVAGKPPPKGLVRCHHCQAQTLLPATCPQCQGPMLTLGLGTQRVEEELHTKFDERFNGGRWLARVDGDTMSSARDYFLTLDSFAKGELRALMGTQMISKGLDFPNVRLVGVINADTALGLPDFRAAERTFQLVSQVAGRAGRGTQAGRVIVQTMDPTAAPIEFAARHDFVGFATQELHTRNLAGLPPISRMARIVCRDQDPVKADAAAKRLADALRAASAALFNSGASGGSSSSPVSIIGPMPCPVSRVNGFHRIAIELTSTRRGVLQAIMQSVRRQGLLRSDARTAVDIDPIALM